MPTPELISATTTVLAKQVWSNYGPINYKGNIYWVGENYNDTANTLSAAVFKSTDGGVTWIQLDAADAPIVADLYAFYPGSGNIITLVYFSGYPGNLSIATINLDTETYTIVSTSGPTVPAESEEVAFVDPDLVCCYLSDGTLVVGYMYTVAFNASVQCNVVTFLSGTWGTPQADGISQDFQAFLSFIADSSDRVTILRKYDPIGDGVLYDPVWDQWQAGLIITSDNALPNASGIEPYSGNGFYSPGNDTLYIALQSNESDGSSGARVLSGTPSSAPVWTIGPVWLSQLSTGTNPHTSTAGAWAWLIQIGSDFFLFADGFAEYVDSVEQAQIWYSKNGGPAVLFWDSSVNPLPPPNPLPSDVTGGGVTMTSESNVQLFLGLLNNYSGLGVFCNVSYYLQAGCPPPPGNTPAAIWIENG